MAGLEIIGILASLAGSVVSAAGASQQADAQAEAKEREAAEARRKARADQAAGTHRADEQYRKTRQLMSNQRAGAAASGGGMGGSMAQLFSDTYARGKTLADTEIWEGVTQHDAGQRTAEAREAEASAIRASKGPMMASAILGGVSSIGGAFKGKAGTSVGGGNYYYG